MKVRIFEFSDKTKKETVHMITELMNYHRRLTNVPKEYWQSDEQSELLLKEWVHEGTIYNIYLDNKVVGFLYVKFGGQEVAWLEDLFILDDYRQKGIGKTALERLDEIMIKKNIVAMFVDVIPRNTSALKLYKECGFDHLNIIQLRKNYNKKLDKEETVDILGYEFKKY